MAAASPLTDAAPATADFEFAIGGMTCAACAARVQAKLNKVDGVTATVNLATERAHVTAPAHVSASDLVAVVEAAGYSAQPSWPGLGRRRRLGRRGAAVRRLRRRLILALVFFVPLTDLSIVLSVFPWSRFPGWQWFLVALAAPVAIWAAWPFHQAALRQARHLSSSMDTLVSLGILAACGWSVYAMFVLDRSRTGLGGLQSLLHASGGGIYLEVAASVTTFLLAGRLYEARARRTAGQAMRELAAAGAKDVCVLGDDGAEQLIPADSLRAGQRFVVRPGERIAADGEVTSGQSAVDRVHDDRRVGPRRRGRGRQRDRRHHRADRPAGGPRGQGRQGHPARAPDHDGRAGPGRKGRHPAPGRPDLRGVRPGRPGLLGPHPGRLAAGGKHGRSRLQRRPGCPDHRLSRARWGWPPRPPWWWRPAAAPSSASSSRATRRWSPPAPSTPWSWTRPARSPPAR